MVADSVLSEALDLAFELEMTQFKHVGLFPEQADNWEFIVANLRGTASLRIHGGCQPCRAARKSTSSIATPFVMLIGLENMERSGLDGILRVVEDALKFARREAKRGNTYHGIILIHLHGDSSPRVKSGNWKTSCST